MATAVKSVTFLRVSASPVVSSAKLSSSSVSSIHAEWRLPGFKGLRIRPSRKIGPVSQGGKTKNHPAAFEDTEKILAEVNKLMDEMKELRLAVDSASKIFSAAVYYCNKIQPVNVAGMEVHESQTEPKPEGSTATQSNKEKSTKNINRGVFNKRSTSIPSEEDYPPSKKFKPNP